MVIYEAHGYNRITTDEGTAYQCISGCKDYTARTYSSMRAHLERHHPQVLHPGRLHETRTLNTSVEDTRTIAERYPMRYPHRPTEEIAPWLFEREEEIDPILEEIRFLKEKEKRRQEEEDRRQNEEALRLREQLFNLQQQISKNNQAQVVAISPHPTNPYTEQLKELKIKEDGERARRIEALEQAIISQNASRRDTFRRNPF